MVNDYNVDTVAIIAGQTTEAFIKNPLRFEKQMVKAGWVFTKTGKGKKAIYHIEDEKKIAYNCVSFNTRRPGVMHDYIKFLLDNKGDLTYLTDRETAEYMYGSDKNRTAIVQCRNELIDHGYMVSLKDQHHCKYSIYDVRQIEYREWADYYIHFFNCINDEVKALKALGIEVTPTIVKNISKSERKAMTMRAGGVLVRTPARELTDTFYEALGTSKADLIRDKKNLETKIEKLIKGEIENE